MVPRSESTSHESFSLQIKRERSKPARSDITSKLQKPLARKLPHTKKMKTWYFEVVCEKIKMTSDQFCLKWNNYQANIVCALGNLKLDEDFVDVTLSCEGRTIKAHKVILSACSAYFKNVFKVVNSFIIPRKIQIIHLYFSNTQSRNCHCHFSMLVAVIQ